MLKIEIKGIEKLRQTAKNVKAMQGRVYQTVMAETMLFGEAVKTTSKDKYLSGRPGLNAPTGNLRSHLNTKVSGDGKNITFTIGTNIVYGRIHEYGGVTKPHDIYPRKAQSLAFLGRSGLTFAKFVRHPGSKIPKRPYLAPSVADNLPFFETRLGNALTALGKEAFGA